MLRPWISIDPSDISPSLVAAAVLASPTARARGQAHPEVREPQHAGDPHLRPAMRKAVVCLVNKQRAERGLPALGESRQLDRSAQGWSNWMVRAASFTHGSNFTGRLSAVGYNWSIAGENIATGFSTPWDVMKGWMGSSDHCHNILAPQFTDIGVGVNSHRLGIYGPSTWTQDFGLPRGTAPRRITAARRTAAPTASTKGPRMRGLPGGRMRPPASGAHDAPDELLIRPRQPLRRSLPETAYRAGTTRRRGRPDSRTRRR